MTITIDTQEFRTLYADIRDHTLEDTIKAVYEIVGMSEEQADKIRNAVFLKNRNPYGFLPPRK